MLIRDLFDRIAALLGLVVFSPVLLAAAAAVWLEDGCPILFRHTRIGRDNRPFSLVKFRSMRDGAKGAQITATQDPRITRTGRILRRYKIDELPQLWNVLRGNMSLVGPRPEVPEYVDTADPAWKSVLCFRPGITDLATLVYRNEEEILARSADPEQYYREILLPSKLALNLRYLRSRSLARDLKLLLLTVRFSFFPAGFNPRAIENAFSSKQDS